MFEKLSTPILIAILLYHSVQYYKQWQIERTLKQYSAAKQINNPSKVNHTGNIPKPRVIKAADNVYVAVSFALANSIMLIGETGVVIIDTTECIEAAKRINAEFRKVTDKPVKGIIYTHNHADHVLGTESFIGNSSNPDDIEIWAHHTLMNIFSHSTRTLGPAHFVRSMHQFGGFLSDDQMSGIGFNSRLSKRTKMKTLIPPNTFLYKSQQDITIAGINLRLIHIPGETDDQIAVFWPDRKILLCADDFYLAFPNLYAIRGTHFRSLKKWYESLDIMRSLHAEILISSHTVPVYGAEKIYSTLTDYRDAVQLVHDQTVRFINQGMHPDEIADRIHLPKALKDKPYLQELYGTVRWSSKGLFSGYMGWFSGDIVELNPHTPNEQATRLIKLAGGIDNLLINAQNSLENNDPQWALRLTSAALRYESTNQRAKELKAKSLFDLAHTQTSMNGYNYYVTCAHTTIGSIQVKFDDAVKKNMIRNAKMKDLFFMMSLKLKTEECSDLNKVVLFVFPDTKEKLMFHLRNGVMDLSGTYNRKEDVKITINSVAWREILSGERSGLLSSVTSELLVEPELSSLQEIMNCIEKV